MRLRHGIWILVAALQAGCGGGGGGGPAEGQSIATATPPATNAVAAQPSTWQPAVAFGTPAGDLPFATSLAVDERGDAVFFTSALDSNSVTAARVYRRAGGQSWTSGEALGDPVPVAGFEPPYPLRHYEQPQVAFDGAGNALALFTYRDHSDPSDANWTSQVVVRRRDAASGSWSAAQVLESVRGVYAHDGRLVLEPGGAAWAVWVERANQREAVFAARFSDGGWSLPERITGDLTGDIAVRVTTDKRGNPRVLIAWSAVLYFSGRSAAGAWTPMQELARNVDNYEIAVDAEDNALAMWREGGVVFSRRFTPALGWENPQRLSVVELGNAHDPQLAMDAAGNAFAVWQQSHAFGTSFTIVAARFEKGRGWVSRETINNLTRAGDDANSPRIGFDASGNAVAVWSKYDGGLNRTVIAANAFTAGAGWGNEEMVSGSAEDALAPDVAVSSSGQAMATWWQEDRQGLIRPWSATRPTSP